MPYQEAIENIRRLGHTVPTVNVKGLASSPYHADIIAETNAGLNLEPSNKLVLLGYSKGTTDILHVLVAHPKMAGHIRAVLSVAGAVAISVEGKFSDWP